MSYRVEYSESALSFLENWEKGIRRMRGEFTVGLVKISMIARNPAEWERL